MTTTGVYEGSLPQPNLIIVHDFAVAPDQVKVDTGVEADIERASNGTPRTDEEMAIGRKVAAALASKLVTQLQDGGFVVVRAANAHPADDGNVLEIKGQFVSIDEGNRTERMVVGFGMGRSDVRVAVQFAMRMPDPPNPLRVQLVETVTTDAKSGLKPGVAETAGASSLVGHVGIGLAAGAGMDVASEAFSANVAAEAAPCAKKIADRVKLIYQARGWPSL